MYFARLKHVSCTCAPFFKISQVRNIIASRKFSSKYGEKQEYVLTEINNNIGIITLNRPKSLNALSLSMAKTVLKALTEWESNVKLVIMRSNVSKAFCAGGDLTVMTDGGLKNPQGIDTFRWVYTMIYTLSQIRVPCVVFTNGLTMGGGVGILLCSKYSVATENSLFAMPETAIGLCPDCGSSYFYSRLEGKIGLYLALTGQILQGKDGVKVGYASHYVESQDIPKLTDAILTAQSGDVEGVMKTYCQDLSNHTSSLAPNLELINKIFSAPTVEEIIERLQSDGSDFSKRTLNQLNKMSPIALKTIKVLLEKAAHMTRRECFQMEFRVSSATCDYVSSEDFYEGIAALKERRAARWNPAKLEDVTDDMVNILFLPLSSEEELQL